MGTTTRCRPASIPAEATDRLHRVWLLVEPDRAGCYILKLQSTRATVPVDYRLPQRCNTRLTGVVLVLASSVQRTETSSASQSGHRSRRGSDRTPSTRSRTLPRNSSISISQSGRLSILPGSTFRKLSAIGSIQIMAPHRDSNLRLARKRSSVALSICSDTIRSGSSPPAVPPQPR